MELKAFLRSSSLYLGLLALFAVSALLNDKFLDLNNQRNVLWQVSNNGIIAIGMTLVILTGGIDLSVGSLLSVGSVICAMLLMQRTWNDAALFAIPAFALTCALAVGFLTAHFARRFMDRWVWLTGLAPAVLAFALAYLWAGRQVPHGFGTLSVFLLVLPFCLLLGALNGIIIAKANLQPCIVTLAMMVSAVGLARLIAGAGGRIHAIYFGNPGDPTGAPPSFGILAENIPVFGMDLIPIPGLFFLATALAAWVLLNKTRLGRYIYAVGGNEEAARFSGIPTSRIKIFVYAASGLLCGLAAVLYAASYQQGKADAGSGRELDAIAAVVIGGTSLMGGRGAIGGTVVGVLIFGYLNNILNLEGVPTEFQAILKGVIIVLAVLLQEGIMARWLSDVYRRFRKPGRPSASSAGLSVVEVPAELNK
jgi:simple sugar transport system permease protein